MKKNLMALQSALLLCGSIFAWNNWVSEYLEYCNKCGSPSPFASPCFFGAIILSITFIISVTVMFLDGQKS